MTRGRPKAATKAAADTTTADTAKCSVCNQPGHQCPMKDTAQIVQKGTGR